MGGKPEQDFHTTCPQPLAHISTSILKRAKKRGNRAPKGPVSGWQPAVQCSGCHGLILTRHASKRPQNGQVTDRGAFHLGSPQTEEPVLRRAGSANSSKWAMGSRQRELRILIQLYFMS